MNFTVSMPQPASHIFHVTFRCEGLKGSLQDFKMPQWSPGYYGIQKYSRNVSNFRAEDAAGHSLAWEKVARNTWRVVTDDVPAVILNYDVFGATAFAASNYLGEDRAYISPASTFVHPAVQLPHPVTIEIRLPAAWQRISTGLEPIKGKPATFEASDFDVLYDSPILIGNQEYLQFDVKGVPHYVAIENVPPEVGRPRMVADLKTMVTAATQLMGDVPYRHYTFLMMGRGGGGIEHSNSSSNQFNGTTLGTPDGYLRWLSFICHEFFHSFNVKRIRPLALGPFDYDQENLTNMLWVSEGLSVYYQDLILVRAGLMSRDQYLAKMASAIGAFENAIGHHYQSATESSLNTWNSGSGVGGDRNTTISYYNNGARQQITTYCDLADRVIDQTRRRVLLGEQVPSEQKVYSIFEPHTDLIKRGKVLKPVEFGHKVFLAESAHGLITDYRVLKGNPADSDHVEASLERHQKTFQHPPECYAGDRGFHSVDNVQRCQQADIEEVCIPQRGGKKTAEQEALERSPAFKKAQRFRVGIEGRISVLFRGRGMKRCRAKGRERFEMLVGAAVLANNLMRIAQLIEDRKPKRRRAAA